MKKNLRKVFAVSMAGAMVAGCIPAMADEAASTTNWEPFAETVTLRVPVYDRGAEGVPDVSNNYWTGWIQENFGDQYNIKVEYVPITRSDVMTSYALLAADPMSGFVKAVAQIYPDKKIASVKHKSVMKRFNELRFASGANRDYMEAIEFTGLSLDDLIDVALEEMGAIADVLGL